MGQLPHVMVLKINILLKYDIEYYEYYYLTTIDPKKKKREGSKGPYGLLFQRQYISMYIKLKSKDKLSCSKNVYEWSLYFKNYVNK